MSTQSYSLPFLEDFESPFVNFSNINDSTYAKKISDTYSIDVLTSEGGKRVFKHDIYFCQDLANDLINRKKLSREEIKHIRRNPDKYMYIPSTLYLNHVTDKSDEKDGFMRLNTKKLEQVLYADHVSKIKSTLSKLDIIEIDRYYTPLERSRRYKLNEKYWLSDWIRKNRTPLNIPCNISGKTHIHNRILTSAAKFTVNLEKFSYILDNVLADRGQDCLNVNRILVDMICDKDLNGKSDPKTGRIFTAQTNVSKEVRPCFELNGRQLVELDIKSSQPLLLTTLYPHDHPERLKYKLLTESGTFYELIKGHLPIFSRDEIKKLTYTYFFGRTGNPNCRDYAAKFQKEFPGMHEILINKKKDEIWGHKIVALELQTIEAAVVLGVAAIECLNRSIELITVHDSFMILPEHKYTVIDILTRAFQSILGLTPQISQKEPEEIDLSLKPGEHPFSIARP